MTPELKAFLTAAAIAFGVLTAIMWFLLPFAVFGIKGLLRDILAELRRLNTSH